MLIKKSYLCIIYIFDQSKQKLIRNLVYFQVFYSSKKLRIENTNINIQLIVLNYLYIK